MELMELRWEGSSHRLWKWLASSSSIYRTALGEFSGKQFSPFMEMVSKQFSRLWKWLASSSSIYRTALGQLSGRQFSPLMEMVGKQFSHLWNC
jgi:hypothetical protein